MPQVASIQRRSSSSLRLMTLNHRFNAKVLWCRPLRWFPSSPCPPAFFDRGVMSGFWVEQRMPSTCAFMYPLLRWTGLCLTGWHYAWQLWVPLSVIAKLLQRNASGSENFVWRQKDNFHRHIIFKGHPGVKVTKDMSSKFLEIFVIYSPMTSLRSLRRVLVSFITVFVVFPFLFILRKYLFQWAIRKYYLFFFSTPTLLLPHPTWGSGYLHLGWRSWHTLVSEW